MASTATAILTAAAHVQAAWEAGNFRKVTSDEAANLGYDIARETADYFEWQDGCAITNSEGEIEVSIPNGDSIFDFFLKPNTGEINLA